MTKNSQLLYHYNLEIEYIYEGKTSWMYYFSDDEDLDSALEKATKKFHSSMRACGWERKTKLVSIHTMRKSSDVISTKKVIHENLLPATKPARKPRAKKQAVTTQKSIVDALKEAPVKQKQVRRKTTGSVSRKPSTRKTTK